MNPTYRLDAREAIMMNRHRIVHDRPRSVRSVVTEIQRQHELPIPRPGLTSLPFRAGTGLWYTIPRWLRVARNLFLPAMRRCVTKLPGVPNPWAVADFSSTSPIGHFA